MDDASSDSDDSSFTLERARPAILRFLVRYDDPVESLELVTAAVRKAECDHRDLSVTDLPFLDVHDRVTTTHLPALDREGLVDYDPVSETVALAVPPGVVEGIREDDEPGE